MEPSNEHSCSGEEGKSCPHTPSNVDRNETCVSNYFVFRQETSQWAMLILWWSNVPKFPSKIRAIPTGNRQLFITAPYKLFSSIKTTVSMHLFLLGGKVAYLSQVIGSHFRSKVLNCLPKFESQGINFPMDTIQRSQTLLQMALSLIYISRYLQQEITHVLHDFPYMCSWYTLI